MFKEDYTKKITNTLSQSNEETNFCIRKKWLDKFKTHFDYNKFNSIIKEGDIYKIIKEYNYNNNYNKFLEDLMQLCPNYFTNKINELSNNKENIRKYFNNEPISLELKENNKIYYYNDEIEIINKKTKDLIQELFDISNDGKYNKFLFGDRKIIMEFNIKSQYSIIIGKYNDNYFVQDILLIFGSEEDMKYYFEKVHKDGYISIAKDLDLQKNLLHYSNIVGKAFYIKDLDNNNIKDINDEEAITDIASFNKENITFSNIDNQNNINQQPNNNQIIKVNIKIKLPNFEEHQIKALISYYLSNEELKLNIESSEETNKNKISNYECYIIDENWMNKYKELFLYDEISQQIEKVLKQSKDIKKDNNRVDNIYNLIINEFIKKMNEIYKIDNINNEQLCAKLVKDINSFPKETFYETFEITNYENYKSFKFIILDEVTYNLMNKSSEKILQDIKIKEYIINEGRIYIKLEDNELNIYQILIASFINTSNYFIPELLFKYDNNISMNKDFDYLKKYNYKKFKNEKMSLNGKELIDKSTCKKVGTIHSINNSNFDEQNNNYIKKNIESNFKISNINTTGLNDLMSKNSNNQSKIEKLNEINSNNNTPFSQSKNNQNEINFYERTKDIFEKNNIKKTNDMANNTPNKEEMKKIDNINIEINLNNISKDNQNIRLKGRNLSNNNNQIFVERILVLDEDKKNFVSFLIRLYQFNKKLFIKIKNSSKFQIVIEEGYIINNKIVEIFNDWFKDAFLMNELHQDNYYITLSKNYQNNHGYISENNIDSFLDLIIKNLPKEYIKKIKDINNSLFLTEFFKKELYTPDIKYYQNNKNYFYFSNCRIINKNLAKCLLYNIKKTNFVELFEKTFIYFLIASNKIFIKFNLHIYIGVIDEKNIFQSEILICCTSENESKHIYNEFKSISMEYFIALTKRVDENNPYIGKYYDTNNIVVILNRKYQINKAAPPKKEKDNLIQMKQILQNQGNNNFYNNRNAQNKINMKKQNDVNKAQNNQQKQFDINNIQVIKNEVKPIIKDNNISRKEIDNLIYIIIELKQLKRKISSKLNKNSTYEIMYPISYDWLNAYLDCYNLKVLNKNKNLYNTIESLINQCQNNTPNETILSMIKNQADIQKIIDDYPCGNPKNYNLLNQISMIPKKSTI